MSSTPSFPRRDISEPFHAHVVIPSHGPIRPGNDWRRTFATALEKHLIWIQ